MATLTVEKRWGLPSLRDEQLRNVPVPGQWRDESIQDGATVAIVELAKCDGCGEECLDFQTGRWGKRCIACVANHDTADADPCVACQDRPVTVESSPWCQACAEARGAV